jgi:hypothetical protein
MGDMSIPDPQPIPEFVDKGIDWLIAAQHENGGWGAGTHANQQLKDPHKVEVDPATTAFAASALLRAGHTPTDGKFSKNVRRATEYLCGVVEEYTKGVRRSRTFREPKSRRSSARWSTRP